MPAVLGHLQEVREELLYRLAPDCKARVIFEGVVTPGAIQKLIRHLELTAEDFPRMPQAAPTRD